MSPKKVLIVCTSWDKLGDTGEPTGCWAEEVMTPYEMFKKHGYDVTVASVKGGEVPFDEASLNPPYITKEVEAFILDDEAMKNVTETVPLADIKSGSDYDAIFLPGGHGTCWDFPDNSTLIKLLEEAAAAGKVLSSVCHGPMGLVNVKGPDGKPVVAGKKITCFTDKEEYAVAKEKIVPFMLETRIRELGGVFESTDNWQVHAVRDGNLITGQNPASSAKVAELVCAALS